MIKQSIKDFLKQIFLYWKHERTNKIETYKTLSRKAKILYCVLKKNVMISEGVSVTHSEIGEYTALGKNSKITHTSIGKFCAISWDITINALNHPYDRLTVSAFPYVPYVGGFVNKRNQMYQKVSIGHDVWIGANSVILPGITIGNGAVIGAGSVVTEDVPEYAIVAGVPARLIKYRFTKEKIETLLKLQWWNLDTHIIKENISLWQKSFTDDGMERLADLCK